MQNNSDQLHNQKKSNKEISTYKNATEQETAQYIADMVLELRNLAKSYNFISLQGLLEVSYYEAFSEANRVVIRPEEIEHLKMLAKASAA